MTQLITNEERIKQIKSQFTTHSLFSTGLSIIYSEDMIEILIYSLYGGRV